MTLWHQVRELPAAPPDSSFPRCRQSNAPTDGSGSSSSSSSSSPFRPYFTSSSHFFDNFNAVLSTATEHGTARSSLARRVHGRHQQLQRLLGAA
ncbi:unnamed protein product [Closterium sp. NIES-53]